MPCVVAWLFLATGCLRAQDISSPTNLTAREEQIIAAARMEAAPRFNGAPVIGIRPGTPFLHSLAVTGARPIAFSTKKLPAGLTLDPQTGIITGVLKANRNLHLHRIRQKFRRHGGDQN